MLLCGLAAPVGPRCAPRAVRLRVSAVATPRRAQPHAGDEGKLQSVARQRSAAAPVRGRRASPQLRLRSDIREARRAPHGDCKKLRGSAAPLVLARSDRGADLARRFCFDTSLRFSQVLAPRRFARTTSATTRPRCTASRTPRSRCASCSAARLMVTALATVRAAPIAAPRRRISASLRSRRLHKLGRSRLPRQPRLGALPIQPIF
jgi:hypothetical protein